MNTGVTHPSRLLTEHYIHTHTHTHTHTVGSHCEEFTGTVCDTVSSVLSDGSGPSLCGDRIEEEPKWRQKTQLGNSVAFQVQTAWL
jgi:hypothetical protein